VRIRLVNLALPRSFSARPLVNTCWSAPEDNAIMTLAGRTDGRRVRMGHIVKSPDAAVARAAAVILYMRARAHRPICREV
jgi:hypothetical protein